MGSGHCLGMCGGIAGALAFAVPQASSAYRAVLLLSYNLGRALSYGFMGLIAGYLGSRITLAEGGLPVLSAVSGVLLIGMGFYLGRWWMILRHLEKVGSRLWRRLQPLGQKLFPVTAWYKAIFLGMVWGWLPCGLVYSALAYSTTQSSALSGAAVMLSFALGTAPAVAGGGFAANTLKRALNHRVFRSLTGAWLIAYGIWLLVSLFIAGPHHHHHH
ncbi:MAG: sulfite exporter TauE/SafE family protein [Cellvibrionaceae bacterium]|nr:sulfite exporter TauE/SafE family protein [Cellvibrionaceae bacterium]